MKIKPLWQAFREMLESAGYRHELNPATPVGWAAKNALRVVRGCTTPKPVVVVRLGADTAKDLGCAVFQAQGLASKIVLSHNEMCHMPSEQRQSAVYDNNAFRIVEMLKGGDALGPWYLPGGALGARAWVARDASIPPDAVQIDTVVDGQVLRDVKPTNYAVGEFLRTVNYYVNEATK